MSSDSEIANRRGAYFEVVVRLDAAGFRLSWPRCWTCLAKLLATTGSDAVGPRPGVYDPAQLRAIHRVDAELGRAALRQIAGWSVAPHDDEDFHTVMQLWEHGHDLDDLADYLDGEELAAAGEGHFVSSDLAEFGRGRRRVTVAVCKDCRLPVWTAGRAHRREDDGDGWRTVWPVGGDTGVRGVS